MANSGKEAKIFALQQQLRDLDARRAAIQAKLSALTDASELKPTATPPSEPERALAPSEKIALFCQLFAGRLDLFALRWENRLDGRSGYAPACANENQAFIPVADDVVERHLRGSSEWNGRTDFVVGVYPLLHDERCWFLAADSTVKTGRMTRSRTSRHAGRTTCRQLWNARDPVTEGMSGYSSRSRCLNPYEDQWAFLASLKRMSAPEVSAFVLKAQESGRILGVRMPVDDETAEDPWLLPLAPLQGAARDRQAAEIR